MSDTQGLIQESLTHAAREKDDVYMVALAAYVDNPFHDLTKDAIADYVAKKSPSQDTVSPTTPVEI